MENDRIDWTGGQDEDDERYEKDEDLVPPAVYRLTESALEKDVVVMCQDNKLTWNRKHPEHAVAISSARIYQAMTAGHLEIVEPVAAPAENIEPTDPVLTKLERVVDDVVQETIEAVLFKETAKTFTVIKDEVETPLYVREGWRKAAPVE